MQIMQEVETCDQSVQTDYEEPKKNRIAKIPMIKFVEVPY
jgi:hypothetical protein